MTAASEDSQWLCLPWQQDQERRWWGRAFQSSRSNHTEVPRVESGAGGPRIWTGRTGARQMPATTPRQWLGPRTWGSDDELIIIHSSCHSWTVWTLILSSHLQDFHKGNWSNLILLLSQEIKIQIYLKYNWSHCLRLGQCLTQRGLRKACLVLVLSQSHPACDWQVLRTLDRCGESMCSLPEHLRSTFIHTWPGLSVC